MALDGDQILIAAITAYLGENWLAWTAEPFYRAIIADGDGSADRTEIGYQVWDVMRSQFEQFTEHEIREQQPDKVRGFAACLFSQQPRSGLMYVLGAGVHADLKSYLNG